MFSFLVVNYRAAEAEVAIVKYGELSGGYAGVFFCYGYAIQLGFVATN